MGSYVRKRLFQGVLLVFVVSVLVFLMVDMMPGDPVEIVTSHMVTAEYKDQLREEYGFNLPIYQRYFNWLTDALQGDFGKSFRSKMAVSEMISNRLPVTMKLSFTALVLEMLIGVPIGLLAAYKKNGFFDNLVVTLSLLFTAIPSFWTSILLILVFGVALKMLPISGFSTVSHYIMPVTALILGGLSSIIRLTKNEVLDVMREKYVLTAYAKGLKKRSVMVLHVLRNSLILVTIIFFTSVPSILSGSVIIENIFGIPGMGQLLTSGIQNQDFPIIQACVLILSAMTIISNLISDIVTALLDPRIRTSFGGEGK